MELVIPGGISIFGGAGHWWIVGARPHVYRRNLAGKVAGPPGWTIPVQHRHWNTDRLFIELSRRTWWFRLLRMAREARRFGNPCICFFRPVVLDSPQPALVGEEEPD